MDSIHNSYLGIVETSLMLSPLSVPFHNLLYFVWEDERLNNTVSAIKCQVCCIKSTTLPSESI